MQIRTTQQQNPATLFIIRWSKSKYLLTVLILTLSFMTQANAQSLTNKIIRIKDITTGKYLAFDYTSGSTGLIERSEDSAGANCLFKISPATDGNSYFITSLTTNKVLAITGGSRTGALISWDRSETASHMKWKLNTSAGNKLDIVSRLDTNYHLDYSSSGSFFINNLGSGVMSPLKFSYEEVDMQPIVSGGAYYIVNKESGTPLGLTKDNSAADDFSNAVITKSATARATSDQWRFDSDGDFSYKLINVGTKKALTLIGESFNEETMYTIWTDFSYQYFLVWKDSRGSLRIASKITGKFITVLNPSAVKDCLVEQSGSGNDNSRWTLKRSTESPAFAGPGGPAGDPTVDPATGEVSLTIPLESLSGGGSPDYSLSLNYNSRAVDMAAQVWNDEVQASTIGLGWSVNHPGRIRRNNAGTGEESDDVFYLDNRELEYLSVKTSDPNTWIFGYKGAHSLDIIEYHRTKDGKPSYWLIKDASGNTAVYGGDTTKVVTTPINNAALQQAYTILTYNQIPAVSNCATGSVEYGVKWGDWIGVAESYTYNGTNQDQQAIGWNLRSYADKWNNTTNFYYVQHIQNVGPDTNAKWYTKGCYLYRVDGANKESVQLFYCSRTESGIKNSLGCDNIIGQRYADFIDPWTRTAEPDAYQERYDVLFLGQVSKLKNGDNNNSVTATANIKYEYAVPGGDANMAKLMLKEIHKYSSYTDDIGQTHSREQAPSYLFDYYGPKDGLTVTRAGADPNTGIDNQKIYDSTTGGVYGKLKSYTDPFGKKKSYQYVKNDLKNIWQNIRISDNIKTNRSIVYGDNYAIIYGTEGAGIYTWTAAGWQETLLTSIGAAKTDKPTDVIRSVYADKDFFFILNANKVLYFVQQDSKSGLWKTPQQVKSDVEYFSASSKTMLLKISGGNLYSYSISPKNELRGITQLASSSSNSRLVANEHYFGELFDFNPIDNTHQLSLNFWPFDYNTGTVSEVQQLTVWSSADKVEYFTIFLNQLGYTNVSGYSFYNWANNAGDAWGKVTSVMSAGNKLYVKFPVGVTTDQNIGWIYATGNNGSEVSYRMTSFQYNPSSKTFTALSYPGPGSDPFKGNIAASLQSRGYNTSSIATDWGLAHTAELFSGRTSSGVPDESHYSTFGTFPGSSSNQYSYYDKGDGYSPDNFRAGSFFQLGGQGDVLPAITKDGTAAYYRYDPHGEQWYNLGNSPTRTFKKIPPSTAFNILREINEVAGYMFIMGSFADPESALITLAFLSLQEAEQCVAPKSLYSIDPTSFSLGYRYLNDANSLWYVTHGGGISPLGTDFNNRASVLTGLNSDYSLASYGSYTGSGFVPFTAKNDNKWQSYIRVLRNGALGKYVAVENENNNMLGTNPWVFSGEGDGITMQNGMFITYSGIGSSTPADNNFYKSTNAVYLHRFIEDKASGNPYHYAVGTVITNDGYNNYTTDYGYNQNNTAYYAGAYYGDVSVYPGGKNSGNGYVRSYFHTGNAAEPGVALIDSSSNIIITSAQALNMVLGNSYKTEYYEAEKPTPVSSSASLYMINQTNGLMSVHTLSQMNTTDSQTVFQKNDYNTKRQMSVQAVTSKNINISSFTTGNPQTYAKTVQTTYGYAWENDKAIAAANLYDLPALIKREILINGKSVNQKPQYTYNVYRDWTGNGAYDNACSYYSISGPVMSKTYTPAATECPAPPSLPSGLSWETESVILERTSQGHIVQSADPKTSLYKTVRYIKYNNVEYPVAIFSNKDQQKGASDWGYNFYAGAETYETVPIDLNKVTVSADTAFLGARSYYFGTPAGTITLTTKQIPPGPVVLGFWAMGKDSATTISVNGRSFTLKKRQWTYVQTILGTTAAGSVTITGNNYYLDDIALHPLNGASFTANVYDFNNLLLTGNLSSDGGNVHHVYTGGYNTLLGSYAVANDTTTDMKISTASLTGYSRWNGGGYKIADDTGGFRNASPNTVFSLVSDEYSGGKYYPSGTGSISIPDVSSDFFFKMAIDVLENRSGIWMRGLNDPRDGLYIKYLSSGGNYLEVARGTTPYARIPLPVSECGDLTIAYTGQTLFIFYANKLVFSENIPFTPGSIDFNFENSGLFFVKNPKISGVYQDAMGRAVQSHAVSLSYNNAIPVSRDVVTAQVYDGWGNPAVATKLSDPNSLPGSRCSNYNENLSLLAYCSDLVKDFNWATYRSQGISGAARKYWEQEKEFNGFDANNDGPFSYAGSTSTPSPLNRNIKSSNGYSKPLSLDGSLGKNDKDYNSKIARDLAFDYNIDASSSNLRFDRHLQSDSLSLYRESVTMNDAAGDLGISIISGVTGGLRNASMTSASASAFPDDGTVNEQDDFYLSPNTFDNADAQIKNIRNKVKITAMDDKVTIDKEFALKINTDLMYTNIFSATFGLIYLTFEDGGKTYCTRMDTSAKRLVFVEHKPTKEDVPGNWDEWGDFGLKNVAFLSQTSDHIPLRPKPSDSAIYSFGVLFVLDSTGYFAFLNPLHPGAPINPFYSRGDATSMKNYNGSRCIIVKKHEGRYTYSPSACLETWTSPVSDTSVYKTFITKSSSLYGGRVTVSREPDMAGPTYTFKDPMGRVRFVCSNYDPKEKVSNGALYYIYDHLGRVTETGTLKNTAGDVDFYLQKSSSSGSSLPDSIKCVKSVFVYDAAYDLSKPFDFTKGPVTYMPDMKNMQGELFAVIKNQSDIPDRPTTTGGDTTSRVVNYYWNKGNQWNGLNVVSSAIWNAATQQFDFRNTYYEYGLNTQKVAYPDRNTGQFQISDSQKRVLYSYDALGNLKRVCNSSFMYGSSCNGTIYADSFKYYINGALKTYVFNDAKLRYNAQYDKLFRLRSISTTNLLTGEEVFRERLKYEKDSTGAGYQGGNIIQAVYSGTGLKANGNNFEEIYNYDYDIFNRLTGAEKRSLDGTLQQTFSYNYDPNGNMTSSQTKDGSSKLTSDQSFRYISNTNRLDTLYDAATGKNQVYGYGDSSEYNNIAGAVKTISYLTGKTKDSIMVLNTEAKTDRVTRIDLPSTKIYYTYDALGRLINTRVKTLIEQIQQGLFPLQLWNPGVVSKGIYFLYNNPYGKKLLEYFELRSTTGKGYGNFPTDGTSFGAWVYIAGFTNAELYSAIEAGKYPIHTWAASRIGNIGDVYIYKNPSAGNRLDFFMLYGKQSDGQYNLFPTDATSNNTWRFIGSVPKGSAFESQLLLKY